MMEEASPPVVNPSNSRTQRQLRLSRSVPIIRKLYHKTEAKHISQCFRKERERESQDDPSLTYGEVDASSFMQILALTNRSTTYNNTSSASAAAAAMVNRPRKFVDLGCGAGLPCVVAAMSPYDFSSIMGIEIVEGLVDLAKSLHQRLLDELSNKLPHESAGGRSSSSTRPNKKNVGEEVNLVMLIDEALLRYFSNDSSESMPIDLLATEVCKLCGHKSYKASIKKYKSFFRLLEIYPDKYIILDNGKAVKLHDNFSEIGIVESTANEDVVQDGCPFSISDSDRKLFHPLAPIQYIHGSIFEYDWWSDCDVAYTASLLFSEAMMRQLVPLVMQLKSGSWFISLKPLPLTEVEEVAKIKLVDDSFFKMSWQMARVFTYQVQEP